MARKKKDEVVEPVANSGTVTRGIEAMPPSDRFSAEQKHPYDTGRTQVEDEALQLIRGADLVQDRAQFGHDAGTTLNTVDDDQVDELESDVEAAKAKVQGDEEKDSD